MKTRLKKTVSIKEAIKEHKAIIRSKYKSVKTIVEGITFDSKKEALFYRNLLLAKKSGEIVNIELQPRFDYEIRYTHDLKTMYKNAFYKADFRVTHKTGEVFIYDVKGYKTATYKRKKKIVEYLYNIIIIEK